MPFTLDPEVGAAIQKLMGDGPPPEKAPMGDYQSRRTMVETIFAAISPPVPSSVTTTDYHVTAEDGYEILLRWYKKEGTPANTPAIVYYHGGGLIAATVSTYDGIVARYVQNTGVPFLSVDYRPAPDVRYPVNVKDAYKGLQWMFENTGRLGVDPARIAVMGDSGGGAMCACITHWNLEHDKLPLVKQILIYPMLDDRNTKEDPNIGPIATWSDLDNATGWSCHLGDLYQADDVPPTAVPARMTRADGLPPGYIEVGEMDIFRDEDIVYAAKFGLAGISMELHVLPGCPHGHDLFAADATVSKRAFADRFRAISSF